MFACTDWSFLATPLAVIAMGGAFALFGWGVKQMFRA